MVAPLMYSTGLCCGLAPESDEEECKIGSFTICDAIAVDALVSITAFVLGMLGIFSVIAMPVAAAYALIGVSTLITLMYAIMLFGECCFGRKTSH